MCCFCVDDTITLGYHEVLDFFLLQSKTCFHALVELFLLLKHYRDFIHFRRELFLLLIFPYFTDEVHNKCNSFSATQSQSLAGIIVRSE